MSKENNGKVKVDIFVPLNACSCQWENFMNTVFQVLTEYRDYITYETKSLNSEEAHELNLHGNSVVLDSKQVLTSSIALEKELPAILKEKGLV